MRSILYTLFISALATIASAFPDHSGTCLSNATIIQGVSGSPMGKLVTTLGYTFTSSMKANYVPGSSTKFTVSGKTSFMGLLLYAVDSQKNHVGSWGTPPKGFQYLASLAGAPCKGDTGTGTISHSDNTLKNNVDFTWTAPKDDVGPISFVGTVVQSGTAGFEIVKTNDFTVAGSKVTGPPSSSNSTTGSNSTTSSPTDSPYGSSNSSETQSGASSSSTSTHSDAPSLTRSALLLQLTVALSLFLYYL